MATRKHHAGAVDAAAVNDWLRKIRLELAGEPDVVPPGYFSVAELAKLSGLSQAHVGKLCRKAAKAGKHKKLRLRVRGGGMLRVKDFYLVS